MNVSNVIAYYVLKNPLYMSYDIRFRMKFMDRLKFLLFGEECVIRMGNEIVLRQDEFLMKEINL